MHIDYELSFKYNVQWEIRWILNNKSIKTITGIFCYWTNDYLLRATHMDHKENRASLCRKNKY
jgi:hypothetical protein